MSPNSSFQYWNEKAYKDPAATALADRLGLDIPHDTMCGFKSGLMYPMRRLVIAGEDTPENMKALFGPKWKDDTASIHQECRHMVLASPAPAGSPMQAMGGYLDEGCKGWDPRPATEEEKDFLSKAAEIQRQFFS
ncbi:MAG: hypothetical protein Q9218_005939 [Villophora microphyllina]